MPVLEFDKVKYCLVYIPGDKRRGFQPFLTYPVEYTSLSQDIYEKLLKNKHQKTRVSISYDDQDFTSIIICVAEEESHLAPVMSWALQVKNLHVPIERIVYDSPRFVTGSRISLPPLQHYPQFSESELCTGDDESDKTSVEKSPAKSSLSASTTKTGQPLSQTPLPTLPDMPSSLRGGCLSLQSKSEESDQSQPTTFKVQTTSNSGDFDDRKISCMKHVNCSNVDNLVRKRGLEPNTVESLYFLISVVLKKQLQLEQEVKSIINSGYIPDTSISEEHFDSEPLVTDIDDFSEKLSDTDFKKLVVKRLTRHAGQNVRQTVKRVLHRMFNLNDLSKMNRNGTDGKKKFIGPVETFVKEVVSALHECSPHEIEKAIASTLKVAANKVRTPNTSPRKTPQNRKRRGSETV